MAKTEIRARAQELYEDEVQYAIARDEEVDLQQARARAAERLGREREGQDNSDVWLGYIDGIARSVERGFEIDATSGQLRLGGALRVGDLVFVPADKARIRDWMALDQRREDTFRKHESKREKEQEFIHAIVDRMREFGGDPTTLEACPDLFDAEVPVA
jgi:hypothetical protein